MLKISGTADPLLVRLQAGDPSAFANLVDEMHSRLLAMARTFTSSPALCEDIVQETWLGVIRGLRGFEARCSLRTWIFSILVRRARTMAAREARRAQVPIEPGSADGESGEWEPGRGRLGLWEQTPVAWGLEDPADHFQTEEAFLVIQEAIDELPERQRQVVLLRDVEDLESEDIRNILGISETNQRVLLHRGRARIRRALDDYVRSGAKPPVRSQVSEPRPVRVDPPALFWDRTIPEGGVER